MTMNNKLAASAVAAALALVLAGSASAQQQAAKPAGAAAQQQVTPEAVFSDWDKDKNKVLSLEEFRAGMQQVQARQILSRLHQNFVAMDKNKSGALEQDEFAALEMVKKAGAKAPMMSAFDSDKNGKLEFKEYVGLVSTMSRNK